ncbi:MAG: YbaB/EbfC family nucleoid-associated protein [Micromonosporaceae bacterium]
MPREIDEAFIEEAIEQYRKIDEQRQEFGKAIVDIEVTVRSPDGLVEIVVTGAGEFRDVTIADEALDPDKGSEQLAQSVLSACQAASHAGQWARQKLYDENFRDYQPLSGS